VSDRPAGRRRAIDGVVLLDKPFGITSQAAVTRAKSAFWAAKAGHTGTLDPMATGLLPLVFGEATKFSHALLDADKAYVATVRLGITTTTGDLEGEVLTRAAGPVEATAEQLASVLQRFRGEIIQTPPMYSALKHAGKPLYEYARAGTDVPRTPRRVTLRELEVESIAGPDVCIRVACSKGTYIRVLAEDLGTALGFGATLAALRRTQVGAFSVSDAVTLDALQAMGEAELTARLLPVDALLAGLPTLELDAADARRIGLGQSINRAGPPPGLVRLYGPASAFLGVGEVSGEGAVAPRRLISSEPAKA
jgi:tRNA pseudouridine55 synthase